jgi:hypothetical protein
VKLATVVVSIMLGLSQAAQAQDLLTGCNLFSIVAEGVTKARNNGVPEEVAAQRALNVVSTNDYGRSKILMLVQNIYENPNAQGLSPETIRQITYQACIGN